MRVGLLSFEKIKLGCGPGSIVFIVLFDFGMHEHTECPQNRFGFARPWGSLDQSYTFDLERTLECGHLGTVILVEQLGFQPTRN